MYHFNSGRSYELYHLYPKWDIDCSQLLGNSVVDHLGFSFISHDSICVIVNTSCCTWLNETGRGEKGICIVLRKKLFG